MSSRFLLLLSLLTALAPGLYIHPRNTVLAYPMEGNANDASPSANNGTATGATLATGRFGKCYSFDGNADRIVSASAVSTPTAFTVLCWWKRLGDSGGATNSDYHELIGNINGSTSNSLRVSKDGTTLTARINDGSARTATLTIADPTAWHCVGMAWNGANLYAICDNVWSSPTAATGTLASGTAGLKVGWYASGYYNANGLIDEVRDVSYKLSQSEAWHVMMGFTP
jgi:hypothetical protein